MVYENYSERSKKILIRLFYKLPYFILANLPLNFLSKAAGKFADHKFSRHFILFFIKLFNISMEEAERGAFQYDTFNDFFTRGLREGVRKYDITSENIISPADGVLSCSRITDGYVALIKNKSYSLKDLLDEKDVSGFHQGHAATIYLSPRDYHRFHMPMDGQIVCLPQKIGGFLFSVMPEVVHHLGDLFCVNERLIYSFRNEVFGDFFLVAVGATFVGSIEDRIESKKRNTGETMKKGEELGAFKFGGSSIVLITGKGFPFKLSTEESLFSGENIRFGDTL